jgi:hypothetical protein
MAAAQRAGNDIHGLILVLIDEHRFFAPDNDEIGILPKRFVIVSYRRQCKITE